nr:hypothetical protein [Tanacetum cinerariifolium]
MHGMGKTVNELHAMLKLHEDTLPKKDTNPALHAIRAGRVQKNQKNKPHKAAKGGHGKGKDKIGYAPNNAPFAPKPNTPPLLKKGNPTKDTIYHQCGKVGHWRRIGLRGSKKLKPCALSLYMGDGHRAAVEAIGTYHLDLPSGLVIVLNNCHYAPSIPRAVISVSHLFDDGKCVSCLSGKMARKPYSHQVERAKDLLGLIHTDVCGPFRVVSREGANYFVTFTDDFSRYGYVYLLKHKHEVFKTFKVFKKEVENQLGKTIKSLRSDRGVEYMSQEFLDHLKANGIISHRTPPYTPQHNDTSLDHEEDDQEIDEPQSDINPIQKSSSPCHAPDSMCLYIDVEEHELGDLVEPANYKAALMDSESNKWLDAMNVEMQSMKDNDVWVLIELPPNARTVGSRGNNILMLQDVKSYLGRTFAMKDLGDAAYILEIKIYRDRSKWLIGLCQSDYIKKILKRYYMENSIRGTIPMKEKLKLSKSQVASTPAEKQRMQNNITSRFQQNLGEEHWTAVKNILKYLRNTKDMFLVYGGNIKRELRVSCYTDAGYLTDVDDLKSQTGYMFVLNGGAVNWKSTKQSIFATSSTDAEYIAAFAASKEAVWIRKFISGLGIVLTIEEPISMYCDNTGAIAIAKDDGVAKGERHFRVKVHYLRETIKLGDVKIEKVDTYDNLADSFTKALAFPKHSELTRIIGMFPANSFIPKGFSNPWRIFSIGVKDSVCPASRARASSDYERFSLLQNYNMHSMGKTVNELHAMLKLHEQTLPKNNAPALNVIRAGKGLKASRKLKPGALSLYVSNGQREAVE